MEKKKIVYHLISSLTEADKTKFKQRIKCGKTEKNAKRHEKLFVYFDKAVKAGSIDEIKPAKIAKSLNLSTPKKLNELYSDLIASLKAHLIQSELNISSTSSNLLLHQALCRRQEYEYIEILHQEIREHITNNAAPTPTEYYQYGVFYKDLYFHPNTNTHQENTILFLNNSETNLETSYWIEKLRLLIEKINRASTFNEEQDLFTNLPVIPNLTQYTHNNPAHILNIFLEVYKLALSPLLKKDLNAVLDILLKHTESTSKEDKELIFNYLCGIIEHNIPIEESNTNTYDIFNVYQTAFTNLWFVQKDGYIYFEDFINLLYLAFDNNDSDLIERIESDFIQYAQDEFKPFVSTLSKAYNYYLHKNWELVLKTLQTQDLPQRDRRIHFIIQRNVLEIKCLYEAFVYDKVELDDIPSYLEKHNRFMQRKDNIFSNHGKLRNAQFVKNLRKLYPYLNNRITFDFDKEKAYKEITAWIEKTEALGSETIEKDWMLSIGSHLLNEVQDKRTQKTF